MRKIYLSFSLLLVAGVMAFGQTLNYDVKYTTVAPAIDGVEEALWDDAAKITTFKDFGPVATKEDPSIGSSYVKALWCDSALFVLFFVDDEDFYPAEEVVDGADYMYDKCETYLDVNTELGTTASPSTANSGAWQVAPQYYDSLQGIESFRAAGDAVGKSPDCYSSHKLTGETYVAEYRIPEKNLYNSDSVTVVFAAGLIIGFDVTIIDQDENVTTTRNRAVWSSDVDEAWNTMAACGTATFGARISSINNPSVVSVKGYPNPVQELLTINTQFNSAEITNMLGQRVMALDQLKSSTINVADLPNGIYFISVYQDAKLQGMTRFIKE